VDSSPSILAALGVEARNKISFWDALIVHAAQVSRVAGVLDSEDLSNGQLVGLVRVVNPLHIA
jgi:predicted nucleic acid-binding protein